MKTKMKIYRGKPKATKTLVIPETELERMLLQWEDPRNEFVGMPEYRFAKCWNCGRTLFFGMWHIFFRKNLREAHLCRRCGKPYEIKING